VTDSPGSPDPDESPQIEEVRRLLAQARHTEPMPDDVVARVDDVLAGLREQPSTTGSTTPSTTSIPERDGLVVSLAAHRRRRAAGLLVAAAVIVVGGVVVAQNLPQSSSSSASEAGPGADNAESSLGNTGNGKSPRSGKPQALSGTNANRLDAQGSVVKGDRLVVRPRRFSDDALIGRRLLGRSAYDFLSLKSLSCASVPTDDGQVLRASYRRAPAALLYRDASGGSQVVDLYVCGSRRPVRTATLPAP
jgi:hypothetical protein